MAVTKILPRNGGLKEAIDYVLNGDKTDGHILTAHFNCDPGREYREMMKTKLETGRLDKRQCYHIIQSFKPGEITPELALEIAKAFAQEHLDGFEVVIGTHVDRHHIHSHIVFNSVNADTGEKYHSTQQSYYQQIRAISDRLCREHGLSVIVQGAPARSVSYIEWLRQSKGQPTFRSMLEADLRDAIRDANDLGHFFLLLYLQVSLLLLGGGGVLVVAAVESAEQRLDRFDPIALALLLAFAALAYALFLAFWTTLCARIKLGRWWENTVCCWLLRLCRRVLRWCWRVLCRAWGALAGFVRGIPLVWRTAVGCCAVSVLLIAFESNHAAGPLLLTLLVLSVAACLFSMQLRRLQKGGEALAAGDLTSQVDTSHMYFDLKRHGENLNAISRGMSIAVEQKLKSERLKTELITNVSHDIKTPLTSIVNYVDLLQREHTPEQEREYLAVLDRQAHKLKKLTVDLVEMSKASTGNIPCHIARRSVRELVDQTVGEYAEKLSAARLEPVVTLPDEDLYCLCDGALMWRVLDNLLSNACKYACAGTRLYIAARREGETVAFSFKNISRDALNIDPDELMERFVRGDSSRTTEGSGLGLNIAKSLVELQKGTFSIAIDGDLFKVGFVLPRTE